MFWNKKTTMPSAAGALPGRTRAMPLHADHAVFGQPLRDFFASVPGEQKLMVGMGCFWGAERKYWQQKGVLSTAVGYAGGFTPNPNYQEVCSGLTGHNEVVLIAFDPSQIKLEQLLQVFWESHDPTQGMRQGNDSGTQYRSGLYCFSEAQRAAAEASKASYQHALNQAKLAPITTELVYPAPEFYFAETEHQQYLAKNPNGYCGLGGTGVSCPIGLHLPETRVTL